MVRTSVSQSRRVKARGGLNLRTFSNMPSTGGVIVRDGGE
jgi:hypothetical protein